MERATAILRHLTAENDGKSSDDDVVICSSVRTPICKSRKGGFKDTPPDDLLAAALTEALKRANLAPDAVQDVIVGNVLAEQSAFMVRVGQLLAGIPESVPVAAVNRQCSSGLQAIAQIAAAISAGFIDVGIGAGVESMSQRAMTEIQPALNPRLFESRAAKDCLLPMGITSENVATKYGVTRQQQDTFAAESHRRAAHAQAQGWFDAEIVPTVSRTQDSDGELHAGPIISQDDGIRAGTSAEGLSKLRPAFAKDGSTTAGNSSQTSDGAAAAVLARRSYARKHNLPILGTFRGFAVCGVPPAIMGIGPAVAIPKLLQQTGKALSEIDAIELNEAFASQALYCIKELGLDESKVNMHGGAIALGHPLGCTGARQLATLLSSLERVGGRYGIISMCIGTGMGAAALIERE